MKPIIFFLALIAGLSPAFADSTASVSDADTIVVTATRTPEERVNVNASTIILERPQIQASQAQDIVELLRFNAGLDISRNGGPGQFASMFIRGAESDHTLVLIDGVKINPGTVGQAALANLNLSTVERIEVVKGPRSTLYGSEAIGGVIQIFTRRDGAGSRGNASLGGGSDKTVDVSAGFAHNTERWRAGVDLSYFETEGFPARVGATEDSGYDNTTVNAFVGGTFGDWDLELSHWQASGNTEYFSFDLMPLDQDYLNAISAIKLRGEVNKSWRTKLTLSHMQDEIQQNQNNDFADTQRTVLDWQNDIDLGAHTLLSAGAYLSREDIATLVFGTGYDETIDVIEGYLQAQHKIGNQHWLAALRYTDHEDFGGNTTGELSWGYYLLPNTRVRAGYSTGFRAPDGTDLFGFGGNPDLEPERAHNLEAGVRWNASANQTLELAVFHNDIDDLIVFVDPDDFAGPIPGSNENIAKARIVGVEANYTGQWGPWSLTLTGILQDPENRITGLQLPRRAKHTVTASGVYHMDPYRVGVNIINTGRRPDSAFNNITNPGYTLVNLTAQRRLGAHWILRGRIENLFDEDYVLAAGFNTQGRALFVQLAYKH